jgi:hypothetical protein
MHTLFKQFAIRLSRLSLPLWSFFPGVAETLIRLPSTSPFTAAPEDPLTRNTLSTWLVVALAAVWLRLKERRAR